MMIRNKIAALFGGGGRDADVSAGEMRVMRALREWKEAQSFFESAIDPELVDCAIFDIEAARRRYVFLLRQAAREEEEACD